MTSVSAPSPLRIAVVGLGYVGLPTAVGMAALGHDVTGVDTDAARIKSLAAGQVWMHEPGLQAGVREFGARIDYTTSLPDALAKRPQIVMIAVQTPDDVRLDFVEQAARDIGRCLVGDAVVVLRSTVPPGTAQRVADLVARERGSRVPVASNPEFLVEGQAFEAFLQPDRIVVGVEDAATADLLRRAYTGIEAPLIVTDIATAELAKYAANAYLATQISFINEMADVAEAAGAEISAISTIIKLDKRVGERAYLNPGIGFGGSCLPKDLRALTRSAESMGVDVRLTRAVNAVNEDRARRTVEKLREMIGDVAGKRIAVWGLAFKGGTNDVRESPAVRVVQLLTDVGAIVRAYDPLAEANAEPLVGAEALCDGQYEALDGAAALMVLTDCREFKTDDFGEMKRRMRGRAIVDGRAMLSPGKARAAGFVYAGIGDRAEGAPARSARKGGGR